VPQQQRLVSWHSFLPARRASAPSAADHCPVQRPSRCCSRQPEKAIGEKSPIEPWLAPHNHAARLRQEPEASLRQHDESTENGKSQSLVILLGLDGKTITRGPSRRWGSICLDIPFYRTGLSEGGKSPSEVQSHIPIKLRAPTAHWPFFPITYQLRNEPAGVPFE
jgi:hypothetical protein